MASWFLLSWRMLTSRFPLCSGRSCVPVQDVFWSFDCSSSVYESVQVVEISASCEDHLSLMVSRWSVGICCHSHPKSFIGHDSIMINWEKSNLKLEQCTKYLTILINTLEESLSSRLLDHQFKERTMQFLSLLHPTTQLGQQVLQSHSLPGESNVAQPSLDASHLSGSSSQRGIVQWTILTLLCCHCRNAGMSLCAGLIAGT